MLGADFGRKYIATALSLIISHSKMHIIAALQSSARGNKMKNIYPSANQTANPQLATLQLPQAEQPFFKFGQERERLKSYVQQQLNGEGVRKNQRILLQFQLEAQQRRHNYLNRNRQSERVSRMKTLNPEQTAELIPSNVVGYKSRFVNYQPLDSRVNRKFYSPLVPAKKTEPPAYNYYNVLPYRSFEPTNDIVYKSALEINGSNLPQRYQSKKMRHSRAMSLDLGLHAKENHRSWALKKIKQTAAKRRNDQREDKRQSKYSSGSSVLSELQRHQKEAKQQCERLGRRLKKLKKYRRFIAQHQNRRIL